MKRALKELLVVLFTVYAHSLLNPMQEVNCHGTLQTIFHVEQA
jgi:hypothetical protein